jgi:hypothetical protein
MVESVLFDEDDDSQSGAKRRMTPTEDTSPTATTNPLSATIGFMKKAKKTRGVSNPHGVGYAGDVREDVCWIIYMRAP